MKLFIIGAAIAATVMSALPAAAQVVIRDRGDTVVVRKHVDRGDRVVVRKQVNRGHHYGWRNHRADCRVVKVRTRLPNGNVIIKTRRTCR